VIGDILQPTHLLFVLAIALLVLGPKRLPEVGRALGRGLRDFRNALNTDELSQQMISSTGTEGPRVEQTPAVAPDSPLGQPANQAVTDPTSPASSTNDSGSSAEEAIYSADPTAPAPTPERVP
jgi:sec-independent protein translocase protein TatA